MTHSSDTGYFRERARISRSAALRAKDVTARSAHARLAVAYESLVAEDVVATGLVNAVPRSVEPPMFRFGHGLPDNLNARR